LQSWRLRRLIAKYPRRQVTHRYGRAPLTVELRDPIGASWYDLDWDDPPEFALLRRGRLRPGAKVFDIGGHQGVIALMLAREVVPDGQVIAVEPSPHNCAAAGRNLELNPGVPLRFVRAAVGAESGQLELVEGFDPQVEQSDGRGRAKFVAEAITIDELAGRYGRPDVLFIDVEGFECQVLRGAASVLRDRPDCFVEVHVGNGLEKFGSVEEVVSHFPEAAYEVFVRGWEEKTFRAFRPGDPVVRGQFLLVALAKPEAGQFEEPARMTTTQPHSPSQESV
jgi:FkbM family methyltransferase